MSTNNQNTHHVHVIDHETWKLGMWIFIFTEILLFAGLFIVYATYRYLNMEAFHTAGKELDTVIGAINTAILLISSMTIAMAVTSIQKGSRKLALRLMYITVILALAFLVNKYFEWSVKFEHGIYPGDEHLASLPNGEILFFGLYFSMTGLHALHVLVGMVVILVAVKRTMNKSLHAKKYALLENAALYWHLVDVIWIFLFPLFYLIA